jgi:pimeloyl-ACP methyl ester carboxylesterase
MRGLLPTDCGSRSACLGLALVPVALSAQVQEWKTCDLRGPGDGGAQCAMVPVPLDHAHPEGATLTLAVKRVPAKGVEARTLWFVDGGPGDAGRASLGKVAGVFAADSNLAIYTFDHRGVGGSAPLECPTQRDPKSPDGAELTPAEWAPCVAHLKATRSDLPYIAVTQAARDLDLLVTRSRTPGATTTVWGVSYGTFLLWEYLRVTRSPPDGVILDGIVPPDWSFAEFDGGLERMGRRWIGLCAGDSVCAIHTRGDPVAVVRAAAESLQTGPCRKTGLTPAIYRLVQGNLLMAGDPIRRLIPVVGYRVERCLPRDRRAMIALFRNLFESGAIGEDPNKHNPIAQRHLALSALWREDDPSAELLQRAIDTALLTTAVSAGFARTRPEWPVAPGPTGRAFPVYTGPLLMLHGELDPTMPPERLDRVRSQYTNQNQMFALVRSAGHVTINENPCVRSIYFAFLRDPTATPDTTCLGGLAQPTLAADTATARRVFGTDDIWGDRPGGSGAFPIYAAMAIASIATILLWFRRRRGSPA